MDLSNLNDAQQQAVKATQGAVLVLAGAGSGKTRVLTTRAAYLIEKGTPPYKILALTFTNKAAAQMRERIGALVENAGDMWVSTFHAMCARLLRIEGGKIGYDASFSIYDAGDSQTVIKQILKAMDIAKDFVDPKSAKNMISRAKNAGVSPDRYIAVYGEGDTNKITARVYARYEQTLKASNALDFDDLLLKVLVLFKEHSDVLKKYQEKFAYIMVDEYQDTNTVQYEIVHKLAAVHGNLFVVGDDDQSIYGWRGADITNILEFEKDFPGATVVRLEQNYRSHQHILDAANGVISNNKGRMGKSLWSCEKQGQKPLEFEAGNDSEEAQFVAAKAQSLLREGKYRARDIAVLYRVNSQSRILENKLKERGVPYEIYGGLSFYDRKEIKDIVAYLNLICNPSANISFLRAVGVPRRGIGQVTLDKLGSAASDRGLSLLAMSGDAQGAVPAKPANTLGEFAQIIGQIGQKRHSQSVLKTVEEVLERSGMKAALLRDETGEGRMRLLNVEEFLVSVADFERNKQQQTLEAFLERNALVSDVDAVGDNEEAIMLMTLHSAKGLEFPVVFIVGMSEGLLPHQMSLTDGDIEEERRLCYVGMTRAQKRLYLTWSELRYVRSHGGFMNVLCKRSRFLDEVPEQCIEQAEVTKPRRGFEPSKTVSQSPFSYGKTKISAPSFRPDISKKAQHAPDEFETGSVVTHPKFGRGTIASVNGQGDERIAVVDFDTAGEKKMFVAFAPLKIG